MFPIIYVYIAYEILKAVNFVLMHFGAGLF